MADGVSTPEILRRLTRFARITKRVLAPYSKLQGRLLTLARTNTLHGITSRTLNMRRTPSLSNVPRIAPVPTSVEITPELMASPESPSLPTTVGPTPHPLSYATRLRLSHVSLIRHISHEPFFLAQVEAARQSQLRKRTLTGFTETEAVGQTKTKSLDMLGETEREPFPNPVTLSPPRLATETQRRLPLPAKTIETSVPFVIPALPDPLSVREPLSGTQMGSTVTPIPSKISQIGPSLFSATHLPFIPLLYSRAVKLSTTFERIPILRKNILSSQAMSQPHVNAPTSPRTAVKEETVGNHAFPVNIPLSSSEIPSIEESKNPSSLSPKKHDIAKDQTTRVALVSPNHKGETLVRSVDRPLAHQRAVQLSDAVKLNLDKTGLMKAALGASIDPSLSGPRRSTPSQTRESSSQNRERLVTTFAEMETAKTKLQLTNRNPIPTLPKVELPRLGDSTLRQKGSIFAVHQSQDARPVELGSNESAKSPLMDANVSLQDWTTPEPESLSSSNELRLRIAKILEEEARRYLPEE